MLTRNLVARAAGALLLLEIIAISILSANALWTPNPLNPEPWQMDWQPKNEVVRSSSNGAHYAAVGARGDEPFSYADIRGVIYIPSYARNTAQGWMDFDKILICRELQYAANAGFNTVRIYMDMFAYLADPAVFKSNVSEVLTCAANSRLRVIPTLFDYEGNQSYDYDTLIPTQAYRTAEWVATPGRSTIINESTWHIAEAYVTDVISTFENTTFLSGPLQGEKVIVLWDVMSKPDGNVPQVHKFVQNMTLALKANKSVNRTLTCVILPGGATPDWDDVVDVYSFANYNGNRGAVAGDSSNVIAVAKTKGKQALLLATMDLLSDPVQTPCESLFEAFGQPALLIQSHDKIGVILDALMIGVNQFSAGHGLVYPNGSWANEDYRKCVDQYPPPAPPLPPGPPGPELNFTIGNLTVGLRNGTHVVQTLGYVDAPWPSNFSFVAPLGAQYPIFPKRENPGSHALGDVTIRFRPCATCVSAPQNWSTVSTALAGGPQNPSVPLPGPFPKEVLDAVDATPGLDAPGQIDSRFGLPSQLGLRLLRFTEKSTDGNQESLVLRWKLSLSENSTVDSIRIGGLGFSLPAFTHFGGMNLTHVKVYASFLDASIGGDYGFAHMSRADGSKTLMVAPYFKSWSNSNSSSQNKAKAGAYFEAFRPVLEDRPALQGRLMEWTVHSEAWAEDWVLNAQTPFLEFPNDPAHRLAWPDPQSPWPCWKGNQTVRVEDVRPWNPPTGYTLLRGQTVEYALKFWLAEGGPRTRDAALSNGGIPIVTSVPSSVVQLGSPAAVVVTSDEKIVKVEAFEPQPLPNASHSLQSRDGRGYLRSLTDDVASSKLVNITVRSGSTLPSKVSIIDMLPAQRGRARLEITFESGRKRVLHMYVSPAMKDSVNSYGVHLSTVAWLPREFRDPFGRSASVMPWDREDNTHVLQDARPFIVGLSDDAGAGQNLALASKVMMSPNASEVEKLDEYVRYTLLGTKPDTAMSPLFSLEDPENSRIRMTLFYYDSPLLNNTGYYTETDKCTIAPSWCAFNAFNPKSPDNWIAEYRAFNFPHQTAPLYALYHTARYFPGVVTFQPWEFYLDRALNLTLSMGCYFEREGVYNFSCVPATGLMDGTIFRDLLVAVKNEARMDPGTWNATAEKVETLMRMRADMWVDADFPYGSEFAWDTTGQEECAVWGRYFNSTGTYLGSLADRTIDAIMAFMPGGLGHWAYDGSAYGMGDFSNNAKYMVTGGWEREGAHYRAGLNSIPLWESVWDTRYDDLYALRVAASAAAGVLASIDDDGAASMSFHTHPFILEHDPYSGDYGLAFFGHMKGASSTYLVDESTGTVHCIFCQILPVWGTSSDSGGGGLPQEPTNVLSLQDLEAAKVSQLSLQPLDSFRKRFLISPLGVLIQLQNGALDRVNLTHATGSSMNALSNDTILVTASIMPEDFCFSEGGAAVVIPYSDYFVKVTVAGVPLLANSSSTVSHDGYGAVDDARLQEQGSSSSSSDWHKVPVDEGRRGTPVEFSFTVDAQRLERVALQQQQQKRASSVWTSGSVMSD